MSMQSTNALRTRFASRLRQAMDANGLTLTAAARLIGSDPGKAKKWVTAQAFPRVESLARICVLLNVGADWLLGLPAADAQGITIRMPGSPEDGWLP